MSFLKSRRGGACAVVIALILAIIISGNIASGEVGEIFYYGDPDSSAYSSVFEQLDYRSNDANNLAAMLSSCGDVDGLREARRNLVSLLEGEELIDKPSEFFAANNRLTKEVDSLLASADRSLLSDDDYDYVMDTLVSNLNNAQRIIDISAEYYNNQVESLTTGINNLPYRIFSTLGLIRAPELFA